MAATAAVSYLPVGAVIQHFIVAGHDIVLGFPSHEFYKNSQFFGQTIGRVANRITGGVIQNLNGRSYQLAQNNGLNHLHGGNQGWGTKLFAGPTQMTRNGKNCVKFSYVSEDGDEGYPGTVELRVWYTVFEEEEESVKKTVLESEYEVELIDSGCEETVVNVTNHSYFNLSGTSSIEGTQCTLSSSRYLPVNDELVPTGIVADFPGLHANESFELGSTKPVFDHCFVVNEDVAKIPLDTRTRKPERIVRLSHPATKLNLEVFSTEPAFQFYTGEYIDVPATDQTPAYGPRAGLCVEPSRFVNAINFPEWRQQSLLKRGQSWGAKNLYKSWRDEAPDTT